MKLLIAAGLGVLSIAGAHAAQRFASGVELVQVDVLVTDGRRAVRGLAAADFELRDNGVVQTIRQVDVERLPLEIVLVLDSSSSVAGEKLSQIRRAAEVVVDRLREGDRAALVTFSHILRRPAALTGDRSVLRKAIASLKADGRTALRDAAYAGLAVRQPGPGRGLMLLFTDGVDTGSFLTSSQVIAVARRSDAVVYAIAARDEAGLPTDDRFVKLLAEETGGRVLDVERDQEIEAAFARVLDEFANRYVLTYSPSGVATPGWHTVNVRLTKGRGQVNARRGYLAK